MTREKEIEIISKALKSRTLQIKRSKTVATNTLKGLGVLNKKGNILKKYKVTEGK